jgi:hypothetical protein
MTITDTNDSTTDGTASVDFAEVANVALERIAEHAITHPMRTLAIAAGVGYTLGRGVPTIIVRLGMIFGARIVTNALVSASLEQIGASMRGEIDPDDATIGDAPHKSSKRRANGRVDRRRGTTAASASTHD